MSEGTVSLPLDKYLAMEDELRELRKQKNYLWDIFGKFFEPKRNIISESGMNNFIPLRQFRLRYNNPQTVITFSEEPYFGLSEQDKTLVIKMLIEHHISDVVKNIDFSKVEFK